MTITFTSILLLVALVIFVVSFVRSKCTNLTDLGLAVWVLAILIAGVVTIR